MNKTVFWIIILSIIYTVGLIGISTQINESFILLTPLNLLVSLAIILWNHPSFHKNLIYFVGICFLTGLMVEIAGVQTGIIFGEYHYGPVLGWKVFDTPLMIGVNWALLVYASACTVAALIPRQSLMVKIISGAALMTALDFLIEPVAMKLDFWNWKDEIIPLKNYIVWFLVALPLHFCFYRLLGNVNNKVAIALFIWQFIFFGTLLILS